MTAVGLIAFSPCSVASRVVGGEEPDRQRFRREKERHQSGAWLLAEDGQWRIMRAGRTFVAQHIGRSTPWTGILEFNQDGPRT